MVGVDPKYWRRNSFSAGYPGEHSASNHCPTLLMLSKIIQYSSHVLIWVQNGSFPTRELVRHLSLSISLRLWETNISHFWEWRKAVASDVCSSELNFRTFVLGYHLDKAFRTLYWATDFGQTFGLFLRLLFPEWNVWNYLWTSLMSIESLPKTYLIFCRDSAAELLNSYSYKTVQFSTLP